MLGVLLARVKRIVWSIWSLPSKIKHLAMTGVVKQGLTQDADPFRISAPQNTIGCPPRGGWLKHGLLETNEHVRGN